MASIWQGLTPTALTKPLTDIQFYDAGRTAPGGFQLRDIDDRSDVSGWSGAKKWNTTGNKAEKDDVGAYTAITTVQGPTITVVNDNVASQVVDVDGEPNAVVDIDWGGGTLELSVNKITLDGTGDGTFTVGPCPSSRCTGKKGHPVTLSYEGDDPDNAVTLGIKLEAA